MKKGYFVLTSLGLLLGFASLAGARTEQVNIQGFAFSPQGASISLRDSVNWTNLDGVAHTATSTSGPVAFNSGSLSQNQSFAFQFTMAGHYNYHCAIHTSMTGTVDVMASGVEEGRPRGSETEFFLSQSQPNPFSDQAVLVFGLPKAQEASLAVYDLLGHRVRTLIQGNMVSGMHLLTWDGRDALAEKLPSGIYLYRLTAGEKSLTQRLILVR